MDYNVKKVALDDFAFKKRFEYGSVLVNQENHKVVDIIDSREKEEVKKWLEKFNKLELVTRDRASSYGYAILELNPKIIQIADVFHLDENITEKGKTYIRDIIPNEISISGNEKIKRHYIEGLMYKKDEKEWTTNDKKVLKRYSNIKILIKEIYKFKHIFLYQDERGFKLLLKKWEESSISILKTMVRSFKSDIEAIINGVKNKLTNGLAEGTVNKIKTIKRMCYGRAKGKLLKNRIFLYDEIHYYE